MISELTARALAEQAMNESGWRAKRQRAQTCSYCGHELHHSTTGACDFMFKRPFTEKEITAAILEGQRLQREQDASTLQQIDIYLLEIVEKAGGFTSYGEHIKRQAFEARKLLQPILNQLRASDAPGGR